MRTVAPSRAPADRSVEVAFATSRPVRPPPLRTRTHARHLGAAVGGRREVVANLQADRSFRGDLEPVPIRGVDLDVEAHGHTRHTSTDLGAGARGKRTAVEIFRVELDGGPTPDLPGMSQDLEHLLGRGIRERL